MKPNIAEFDNDVVTKPYKDPHYIPTAKGKLAHRRIEDENVSFFMADGAAGTGKSIFTVAHAIDAITRKWPGSEAIFGAETEGVLFRTTFATFKEIVNPRIIADDDRKELYRRKKIPEVLRIKAGDGTQTSEIHWVPLDSEGKIRGQNLRLVHVEEGSEVIEDAIDQSVFRFRKYDPGEALLIINTNPDAPGHHLFRRFHSEQRMPDSLAITFLLQDNPYLSQARLAQYEKMYPPGTVWYERFMRGRWVMAEGAVWPEFDQQNPVGPYPHSEMFTSFYGSFDRGFAKPTAFVLQGVTPERRVWNLDEWGAPGQTVDKVIEHVNDCLKRNNLRHQNVKWICDRAAADFRAEIRRVSKGLIDPIMSHSEDREGRFRRGYSAVKNGIMKYSDRCTQLVGEIRSLRWPKVITNEKKMIGEDHYIDAHLYGFEQIDRDFAIFENVNIVSNFDEHELEKSPYEKMRERMQEYGRKYAI